MWWECLYTAETSDTIMCVACVCACGLSLTMMCLCLYFLCLFLCVCVCVSVCGFSCRENFDTTFLSSCRVSFFKIIIIWINHVSIRPAVGTIVLWKYLRESSFPRLWHGLTFQLLPVLHSIKTPQRAVRKEADLTEHVLFLFHFNRKLFIQRINHKILQTSDFIMQPSSNYTQL